MGIKHNFTLSVAEDWGLKGLGLFYFILFFLAHIFAVLMLTDMEMQQGVAPYPTGRGRGTNRRSRWQRQKKGPQHPAPHQRVQASGQP